MDKESVRFSLQEICNEFKSAKDKQRSTINGESSTSDVVALAEKSTDTVNKELDEVNSQNNLTIKEVIELENFSTTVAEKLYEIPTAVLSLCESALCKRQNILEWLQTLLFNSDSTISSEEFACKLREWTSESDELAMSYNVAITRLRRGVDNTMDLLQKIYLERDLLKERNQTLSVQMAELQTINEMLQHRFLASSGDQPAKESRVKELELELINERNRKAILRERLQKADARAKARNEELKDALVKLENSDVQRAALAEKIKEIEKERSASEKEYLEQVDKSKASFDENLEKLDKINEHVYELEQIIETQRQQLDKQSSITNIIPLLEADINELRKTCEKYQSQIDTMEHYTCKLETTNQELLHNLKNQTESKEDLAKELEILKSEQKKYDKEENEETLEKTFIECEVQTNVGGEEPLKIPSCESPLPTTSNQLSNYEQQVELLRNVIAQLGSKRDGAHRSNSIPELKDVVVTQRTRLVELTQEIDEIRFDAVEKDALIKKYEQSIEEQASLLRMKDEVIQMLTCKDAELMNAVEFLQYRIEAKQRVENEIKSKLAEQSGEIRKLLSKLELKKTQALHLERLVMNLQKRPPQKARVEIDDFVTHLDELNFSRLDESQPTRVKQQSRMNVEKLLKLLEYELDKSENIEFQRLEDEARCFVNELPVLECKQSTGAMKRDVFGLTRSTHPTQAVRGLDKIKEMCRLDEDKSECMVNFRPLFEPKLLGSASNDANFVFNLNNESIFKNELPR